MSSNSLVYVELHGHRGELLLNREKQKNALTGPLVDELKSGLQTLIEDPECHVILLRGSGGVFCAGLDVKAFFSPPTPAWVVDFADNWSSFHAALYACRKPVIGALEKYAIGGGAALALGCDLLVAGNQAFMHVLELEKGLAAPLNVAWLQIKWGAARSLDLALGAERWNGVELVKKGLAYKAVPDDLVLEEARALADRLAGYPPKGLIDMMGAIKAAASGEDFYTILARIRESLQM